MRLPSCRVILLAFCALAAGCASRPLPPYQQPLARAQFQHVRTTAYTDTESDHIQYSNHNALGTTLQSGPIHSAAADWSRWPAGTLFRIVETGELYQVDDYGWALAGTNTIDLYKSSRSAMNAWGVRRVTIENLQWGDPHKSLAILQPRGGYRHVQRMLEELESRLAELSQPVPASAPASVPGPAPALSNQIARPIPPPFETASAAPAPRAIPVSNSRSTGAVARDPFFANSTR